LPTEGLTGENEKVRERNLAMKTNLGVKPLYVVNLGDGQGYYAADVGWKGVPKAQADKMTHKSEWCILRSNLFNNCSATDYPKPL
jgi:hypothetical protein